MGKGKSTKGKGAGSKTETVLKEEKYKERQEEYQYKSSFEDIITEENYANLSAPNRRLIHMNEELFRKGYNKDSKFKVPPNSRNSKGIVSLAQARNFYGLNSFESRLIPKGGEKLIPVIRPYSYKREEEKDIEKTLEKLNFEEDEYGFIIDANQKKLIEGYLNEIHNYLSEGLDESESEDFKELLKDLLRVVKGRQPKESRDIEGEEDYGNFKPLEEKDANIILERANGIINSSIRGERIYQFKNGKLETKETHPLLELIDQLEGTLMTVAITQEQREHFRSEMLDLVDYIQYEQPDDVALTLIDIENVIEGKPSKYNENIKDMKVGSTTKKNIKDAIQRLQKASGTGIMSKKKLETFNKEQNIEEKPYIPNPDIIPEEEKEEEPVFLEGYLKPKEPETEKVIKASDLGTLSTDPNEEMKKILEQKGIPEDAINIIQEFNKPNIDWEVSHYLETQNIQSSINADEDLFEVYDRIIAEIERRKNIPEKENILLDKKMEPEPTETTPLLEKVENVVKAIAPTVIGAGVGMATENPLAGQLASSVAGSILGSNDNSDNTSIGGSIVSETPTQKGAKEPITYLSGAGITGLSGAVLTPSVDGGAMLIPPSVGTESVEGSQIPTTEPTPTETPKDMPKGAFYPNPIHKYALSVFFGSATSPAWDMELFRGLSQDADYQDLGARKKELLTYSRMIVGKFGVDILVPFLRYGDSATPEQVLQENHEIMQLYMSKLNNRKGTNEMSGANEKTVNMKLKDLQEFRNLLENGAYTEASMTTEDLTPKQEGSLQMLQNGAGYEGQNAPNMQLRTTEQKQKFADPKILNALTPTEQRWMTPGAIPMKNRKFIGNEGKNVMLFPEQSKDLSKRVIMGSVDKNMFLQRSKDINSTSEKIQTKPLSMKKSKLGSMDCYSMKSF